YVYAIAGGGTFSIDGSRDFSLAVWGDERWVLAWGANNRGQCGNGDNIDIPTPELVQDSNGNALRGCIDVKAGFDFGLALRDDGPVWAWGGNDVGQLGAGRDVADVTMSKYALQVRTGMGTDSPALQNIIAIAAGGHHGMALDTAGQIWMWGSND